MVKNYLLLLLSLLFFQLFSSHPSQDQGKRTIERMQDSLVLLSSKIVSSGNDSVRLASNAQFKGYLKKVISGDGGDAVVMDSVKLLTKIMAPDKSFHIYTWALPMSDGRFRYFGFLQVNKKSKGTGSVVELFEAVERPSDLEFLVLEPSRWFGAVYYKVVVSEYRNQRYYTLLGWHGTTPELSEKVIEVLTFGSDGSIRFGAGIFPNYGDGKNYRIDFKFSSNATMFLDYDEQFLPAKKKWNKEKKEFDIEQKKEWMIVCDDLVPSNPILEGQYEFYIPSSEAYHGFVFEGGFWVYYQNIDARNR